jgi:hypothetical protein
MSALGYTIKLYSQNLAADAESAGVRLGRYAIPNQIPASHLSEIFGVSRNNIYSWFNGEWRPRAPRAVEIDIWLSKQQGQFGKMS